MKYVMNVDLLCIDGVMRTADQEIPAKCVTDYMVQHGLVTLVEEVVETEVSEPVEEVEETEVSEPVEEVVEEQLLTEVSEPVEVEVEETKPTRKKGRGRR